MKRGIQNKANLISLAIWYMKEYALERPDGDPMQTFWLSKIKKVEGRIISLINILEHIPEEEK